MTLHDEISRDPGGHRLVHGAIADVLVRVRGGVVCSGTPITGTRYVVTAAHCVLDSHGNAAARTVVRDGVSYTATAVLVDSRYFDEPTAQFDAAVLVMDQVIPGRSAIIGTGLPTRGSVTIAGFQSLDSDGTLLRARRCTTCPSPRGRPAISSRSSRCPPVAPFRPGRWQSRTSVDIPCGLIPGASGGGIFAEVDGTMVLVGIVSTVTSDLTSNGVVPLESLHELLRHPEQYWQEVTVNPRTAGHPPVVRS